MKFRPNKERGSYGREAYDVVVYCEVIGFVRKRREYYGNLGRRGVTYTYWDAFTLDGEKVDTRSTRKDAADRLWLKVSAS